jgi:transcriptional regulator with XRE-family HTH domain
VTSAGQAWQGPRGCGPLLRRWRELRRLTQLDLALDAGISARHLSYIETGKTLPSREMLLALAQTLDLPLRERNLLFLAAGYAPLYEETPLTDARMNEARTALQLILRQHEPYSAFACDRYWNLVMANDAYLAFLRYTVGARARGARSLRGAGRAALERVASHLRGTGRCARSSSTGRKWPRPCSSRCNARRCGPTITSCMR